MINTVIFDLDGTLADTKQISIAVAIKFLKKHNYKYNDEKLLEFTYRGHAKVLLDILKNNNVNDKTIISEVRDAYVDEIRKIHLYPNALNLLEKLKMDKIILALATFSTQRSTEVILDNNNIRNYFNIIVCRDTFNSVEKTNLIKELITHNKLNAKKCILVEDTSHGVLAGIKNNVFTIGVLQTQDKLKDADIEAKDLFEVEKIIFDKINKKN